MSAPTIDFLSSGRGEAFQRDAIDSLQANRIDSKFLYVTPHQAELWRQVFLKHSPIHTNPEFARIYDDAFARIADRLKGQKRWLVGLGCGTGLKEQGLFTNLKANGGEVIFSAVDVSHDLVLESVERLIKAGASHRRSLVCDLTQVPFLENWLNGVENQLPRIITFFGLVPNFNPLTATRLLRAVLRPGDILLASAHLVPARTENPDDIQAAMNAILPQYDNPETLAWLAAALRAWNLDALVEPPQMKMGELEEIPAFLAFAQWKNITPFERWGHRFSPKREEPLRLFFSLRHTPALFESLLRQKGFSAELLSVTSCRQEAIWCIQRA